MVERSWPSGLDSGAFGLDRPGSQNRDPQFYDAALQLRPTKTVKEACESAP